MEFQLVSSQKAQSTNKLKVSIKVLWGKVGDILHSCNNFFGSIF